MPPKYKIKPSPPRPGSAATAATAAASAARSTGRSLIIVESPAKCQKIESYLGKDKYTCLASFGHIREIADGLKSIDVDHEFAIKFKIMSSKHAQVAKLRAAIADASEVILATDDDREGEAIAWHLCQVFHLSVATTKRIIFHEITEPALKAAVAAPRVINMSLVLAQQARQVLDLVVGYKISPVLWTYVAHTNLSAGRCQTPALRLVYENYKEIEAAKAVMVYTVSGIFTKLNLTFHLSVEIESTGDSSGEESLERFIRETAAAPDAGFRASISGGGGPAKKTTKAPPRPYTTSTLQQAASNDLHLSPKDTMSVAQKLYEGGYITYMRTDSRVYSADFVAKACDYIRKRFGREGEDLIGNLSAVSGSASAAAHEAIRPTDISRTLLPQSCHPREHRLYSIIHRNTLESLMAPAICQSLTMVISSPVTVVSVSGSGAPTACEYRYTAEQVIKPGWKLVAGGYDKEANEYTYFASLAGSASASVTPAPVMPFKRITTKCSLRNTKSHYTESGLVQMLEKMGIGRPSTFSSLIDKIQERGYVKLKDVPGKPTECREFVISKNNGVAASAATVESKTEIREIGGESRKLVIQPLGIIVIEFLLTHFAPLFEYEFTKNMETQLDEIATDGMIWHELCYKCWFEVTAQLQELKERGVVKEEIHIDDRHSYILGKNGPVIRCRVSETVSETIHSGDDDNDDDTDADDASVGRTPNSVEKKLKFIFKSVRPNLEYAKIQRGEYSLAYMLGEADAETEHVGAVAVAVAAPVSVAGGGRLMGQYQGQDIIIKSGKYGAYVVWGSMNLSLKPLLGGGGRGGGGGKTEFDLSSSKKATMDQKSEFDLSLQDVIAFIEKSTGGGGGASAGEAVAGGAPYQGQILRTIDENTTIRYGRYGPYIFHKTQKMTKPAFVALKGFPEAHGNYITCDVAKIHEWITATAGAGGGAPAKPKPKFGFFKKK
jgi:DNA topoisomerase-1